MPYNNPYQQQNIVYPSNPTQQGPLMPWLPPPDQNQDGGAGMAGIAELLKRFRQPGTGAGAGNLLKSPMPMKDLGPGLKAF